MTLAVKGLITKRVVYNKVKFGKSALMKKWFKGQKVSKTCENEYFLKFWGLRRSPRGLRRTSYGHDRPLVGNIRAIQDYICNIHQD